MGQHLILGQHLGATVPARLAGVTLACVALLAGCSEDAPSPTDHTPAQAAVAACQRVMAKAPTTVGGHDGLVNQVGRVAHWGDGDDRVVLRCGVAKPAGLSASSRCDVVNGVGWWAEKTDAGYRFTTIGRQAFVQVEVPTSQAPEADVLNELTTMVEQNPVVTPCV